ncbi:neurotrimin isoform X9 [Maylandia zebra]|uniref:neurotrimin isoform X9 n=1 Tax=Maylandia zebra TaxID=106582 RepID=UPI00403C51F8
MRCQMPCSRNERGVCFSSAILVPPKITNLSRDVVVNEGSNITLMCQASGKPEPSISWKLISSSGDLVSDDEYLEIPSISRQKAGTYECTAVNDIDTDVQTVDITVNYAPAVSEGRDVGVTLGQRGVLECEADAVPEADFEWYKDNRRIFNDFDGMEIVSTGLGSKLTFFNVSDGDYGNYTCVAINTLGSSNTSFLLFGAYDGILLGDRGYACRQYFMTPFPDPNPGPQTRYNAALARTRARIEMTFGQIKGRFQCLKSLRVAPDRACDIIVACAVLHNIATIRKERTPVVEVQPDDDLQPVHLDQPSGRAARDRIVQHNFEY